MYLQKDYAKILLDVTGDKFERDGIFEYADSKMLRDYKNQLETMAEATKYEVGEKILPSDFAFIKATVKAILEEMKDEMIAQRDDMTINTRLNYDQFSALVTANDYLYAMAMHTLGCPFIPESFGSEVTDYIDELASDTELEIREEDYSKATVERHFNNQRKESADFVRKSNEKTRNLIINKTASAIDLASYAAEYYALKKRQEGHGRVWRFFHGKENEERNQLLAEMKKLLVSTVGGHIDIDSITPEKIAIAYTESIIADKSEAAFAENALANRADIPEEAVKNEPTSTERADNDKNPTDIFDLETEDRKSICLDENLFQEDEKGEKEIDFSFVEIKDEPHPDLSKTK